MRKNLLSNENGQAIVILAIAIVGLIALMALVIDGGMLYSYRYSCCNSIL